MGECQHRRCCAMCALKLRIKHKDERCVLCKAQLDKVFVVKREDSRKFDQLVKNTWDNVGGRGMILDEQSAMFFSQDCNDLLGKFNALREFRCGECEQKFPNVKGLEKHLEMVHAKFLCKLCLEFRGLLLMEHPRYTAAELVVHYRPGDGHEGHPSCKFCKGHSFYNSDALYKHLNEKHELCHLCAKAGSRYQYFRDYAALEHHFGEAHFLCPDARCRENRFVAFYTDLQLQAHVYSEHPDRNEKKGPLAMEFFVKGSRHAHQHDEEEEFDSSSFPTLGATSSTQHFPPLAGGSASAPISRNVGSYRPTTSSQASALLRDPQSFPLLSSNRGGGGSSTASYPAPRRYATSTSGSVGGGGNGGGGGGATSSLFANLTILAGPDAENHVKLLCIKLIRGDIAMNEFYGDLQRSLGDVTLAALLPDVRKYLGGALGDALWDWHKERTNSKQSWTSATASAMEEAPLARPVLVNDESAFPTLGRSKSRGQLRLNRDEVRGMAFTKKEPRQVQAPPNSAAARVMTGRRQVEEQVDADLSLGGGAKKSKKKSGGGGGGVDKELRAMTLNSKLN